MYNKVKNKEGKPYKPERITGMRKVDLLKEKQIKSVNELAEVQSRIHDNWNGRFNEYATRNILNEMEWRVGVLVSKNSKFNEFADKAKELATPNREMTVEEIVVVINQLADLANEYIA